MSTCESHSGCYTTLCCARRALAIILLAPFLLAPFSVGAVPADFKVQVEKVPGATSMHGRMEGTMPVRWQSVLAVLCDYDRYDRFVDTVRKQAVIDQATADALRANPPEDPDAIEHLIVAGAVPANCDGAWIVLTYQDFPFPLSDVWLMSRYVVSRDADGATVTYQRIAGSSRHAEGTWTLKRVDDTHTFVTMDYINDLGVHLPEFLIRWGASGAMPEMFDGLERLATGASTAGPPTATR